MAIPGLVTHYALGLGAIGKPAITAIVMLTLDAVFVGALGVVLAASRVIVAERMLACAGAEPLRLTASGLPGRALEV